MTDTFKIVRLTAVIIINNYGCIEFNINTLMQCMKHFNYNLPLMLLMFDIVLLIYEKKND